MTIKKNLDIEAILDAINKDHLVVFVGAGVSANSNLPSWAGLVKVFASGLGVDRKISSDDYLTIPQYSTMPSTACRTASTSAVTDTSAGKKRCAQLRK